MVDTYPVGKDTRMVISATGNFEHLAYQAERQFTVEVKPVTKAAKEASKTDESGYSGEKLSLNFQDIDVRSALQIIADFTGLNMVVSDSVKGGISLRLKDVPWDQSLDIILKTKGLGMRRMGNVMMVAPSAEISAREKDELEASRRLRSWSPPIGIDPDQLCQGSRYRCIPARQRQVHIVSGWLPVLPAPRLPCYPIAVRLPWTSAPTVY